MGQRNPRNTQKRQKRQTPKNTQNNQNPIPMSKLEHALKSPTREGNLQIAPRNRRPYLEQIRQFNRNNPKRRTLHNQTINLPKKLSRRSNSR